ncbi:MAG: hypothetical protein IT306_07390 [Chloroflexi bacterium]|nr:hypothetical protein [Chloroflexota bacterium]
MTDRPAQEQGLPQTGVPVAPDADTPPSSDPMPIPGAAGPMGGSPTGELIDGVDQPVKLPGDRPPLTTD